MEHDPNSLTPIELIQLIVDPLVGRDTLQIVGNERSRELIQAIFFSNEEDPMPLVLRIIEGYEAEDEEVAGHAGIYAHAVMVEYQRHLQELKSRQDQRPNNRNGCAAPSPEPQ